MEDEQRMNTARCIACCADNNLKMHTKSCTVQKKKKIPSIVTYDPKQHRNQMLTSRNNITHTELSVEPQNVYLKCSKMQNGGSLKSGVHCITYKFLLQIKVSLGFDTV
jgi:hypothetical protein